MTAPAVELPPVGVHWHSGMSPAAFGRRIEALGFEYVTCGEHVAFHQQVPNALVTLAAIAGATSRVRLLSSLVLVPLYPAALLAKMVAQLDVVSDGRFEFGAGVGGEFPPEFEACGVPLSERGARADEALEAIGRLLTERDVDFSGRFNQLSGITIDPPPVQRPRPPIWVGGRSPAAIRRAARYGDRWLPYMIAPERLESDSRTLRTVAAEHGRAEGDVTAAAFLYVTVYDDGEKARRVARERLGAMYAQDFTRLVDRYVVVGDPADCRRRLAEYAQAGASAVVLSLACPDEDVNEMTRALAEDVLGLPGSAQG